MADLPAHSAKVNSNDINEELVSFADEQSEVAASPPTHISVQIEETTVESERIQPRILHRVPQQLKDKQEGIYEPVYLSLGPYHYSKCKQFRQLEELKDELVNVVLGSTALKDIFRSKILEGIDEIRIFYGGVSTEEHDDDALAEMMLRDACFVKYYMERATDAGKGAFLARRLGLSVTSFFHRDYMMLENQIPLWIIKLLITLTPDGKLDDGEAFICSYLSQICFGGEPKLIRLPWKGKEEEPLHLLEASRRARINEDEDIISSSTRKHSKVQRIFYLIGWRHSWGLTKGNRSDYSYRELLNSPFRSVTDLKAKGIFFRPTSHCLTDIRFNSYMFYGMLQLPIRWVTKDTKGHFSNLIAFETSPETNTKLEMVAYVNFMKSLIESPKDAKELREKGILFSTLRNDEEVVKVFKEINTHGIDNFDIFMNTKIQINKHCQNKGKIWIAELIYTYFRSPWTTTALLASILLLCLTFIQTYSAVHPQKVMPHKIQEALVNYS